MNGTFSINMMKISHHTVAYISSSRLDFHRCIYSENLTLTCILRRVADEPRSLLGASGVRHEVGGAAVNSHHRLSESLGHLREHLGIVVVRHRLHDGARAPRRVTALEDAASDEHAVASHLHHERGVGGRGDTSRGEVHDGQASELLRLLDEFDGRTNFLRVHVHLVFVHVLQLADGALHGARVAHSLDDVSGSCLTLGADHRAPFGDAPERLAEVAAAAEDGHLEVVFVDVVDVVCGREHLRLVDVVDSQAFEDLRLDEVSDARLGHDWDGHGVLDGGDHRGVGHARDTSILSDVRGNALERHDRDGARLLGDARLLDVHDVHDDATLEHLRKSRLNSERVLLSRHGCSELTKRRG
mmetsp:Transcript_12514/g.28427  ORF Transcript_12514/g.28427 Transcript_12514/m.28427 type:complete len:357 (+) Transcript_12514:796-1866(+)